jgi:tetratricopeptide (TPR) repeat protein
MLNVRFVLAFALIIALFLTPRAFAETASARAERIYRQASAEFKESPSSITAAWQFGRACFDLAEFAKNDPQRAALAEEGIAACRAAIARKYSVAPAHHYLALNLGQLARTKTLGALKLVREMETEFKAAIELDPKFDHAGAHRSLGMLYKEAPGWPTSIGNRNKAKFHLRKAVELSPDYPENRLTLLEACLDWGDRHAVVEELPALAATFESARKKLTGDEWTSSWRDWENRLDKLKFKTLPSADRAVSPRGK